MKPKPKQDSSPKNVFTGLIDKTIGQNFDIPKHLKERNNELEKEMEVISKHELQRIE